ncbi:MAG: mechanosensitive ion channel family protein [Anderseniella sp.]
MIAIVSAALAEASGQTEEVNSAPSPKVQQLLQLLGDDDVQNWLRSSNRPLPKPLGQNTQFEPSLVAAQWLEEIQTHLQQIMEALPNAPRELKRAASNVWQASESYGSFWMFLLVASFFGIGLTMDWLFRRATAMFKSPASRTKAVTPRNRLVLLSTQILLSVGSIVAFGIGSLGVFLIFDWPDLVRSVILTFLFSYIFAAALWSALQIALAPAVRANRADIARFRLVPMSDDAARFFTKTLGLAIGWYAIGHAVVRSAEIVGIDENVSQLLAYILGSVLLLIGLATVWLRPIDERSVDKSQHIIVSNRLLTNWLYSIGFIALWVLWTASALRLFGLLAVGLTLPLALKYIHLAVHETYSTENSQGAHLRPTGIAPTVSVCALRALLILGSIALLSWSWGLDLTDFVSQTDPITKLSQNIVIVLIILLVADLLWQLTKAMIGEILSKTSDVGEVEANEAIRRAKLQTLLPILRTAIMVFLATLALLMSLSALGVEIGPLIASAGVVGLALGFGAQTLVKDVISGMFYLFDDAFRIGEYIIAGKYKGTVESFSLRSVRLRHHRGPIYTIPFGDLGAVQNMSRDYVIDKLTLNLAYNTDLEKTRKLIKKVGLELAEDPDLGPSIISPLKMQRVESFGDYGIEIKLKMTTVPGGQYEVRQKFFPLIKKRFEENGIQFAVPTMTVSDTITHKSAAAAKSVATRRKTAQTSTSS